MRVWLVTPWLGTGKSLTFFTVEQHVYFIGLFSAQVQLHNSLQMKILKFVPYMLKLFSRCLSMHVTIITNNLKK